ncbi:Rhamnolipids biosynthesis 3-oxoacyl-[acyl-carrier-protein] reductase [compost metagenome]
MALVTGGAKGVGAMIASTLVRAGCQVIVTGRSQKAGEAFVSRLAKEGQVEFRAHDLVDGEQIKALVEHIRQRYGRLDILVNNAGTFSAEAMGQVAQDSWDQLLEVNLRAPFMLIQQALPLLERDASQDPARVINIGSIGGLMPQSNGAYAYGCSKAGVHQLTRMLASDLRNRGVTVNAIAPGYFPSDMTAGFFEAVPNLEQQMLEAIPAGRFGSAEDIGGTVVYLSSRASAYLTGTVIQLDGGLLVAP